MPPHIYRLLGTFAAVLEDAVVSAELDEPKMLLRELKKEFFVSGCVLGRGDGALLD